MPLFYLDKDFSDFIDYLAVLRLPGSINLSELTEERLEEAGKQALQTNHFTGETHPDYRAGKRCHQYHSRMFSLIERSASLLANADLAARHLAEREQFCEQKNKFEWITLCRYPAGRIEECPQLDCPSHANDVDGGEQLAEAQFPSSIKQANKTGSERGIPIGLWSKDDSADKRVVYVKVSKAGLLRYPGRFSESGREVDRAKSFPHQGNHLSDRQVIPKDLGFGFFPTSLRVGCSEAELKDLHRALIARFPETKSDFGEWAEKELPSSYQRNIQDNSSVVAATPLEDAATQPPTPAEVTEFLVYHGLEDHLDRPLLGPEVLRSSRLAQATNGKTYEWVYQGAWRESIAQPTKVAHSLKDLVTSMKRSQAGPPPGSAASASKKAATSQPTDPDIAKWRRRPCLACEQASSESAQDKYTKHGIPFVPDYAACSIIGDGEGPCSFCKLLSQDKCWDNECEMPCGAHEPDGSDDEDNPPGERHRENCPECLNWKIEDAHLEWSEPATLPPQYDGKPCYSCLTISAQSGRPPAKYCSACNTGIAPCKSCTNPEHDLGFCGFRCPEWDKIQAIDLNTGLEQETHRAKLHRLFCSQCLTFDARVEE